MPSPQCRPPTVVYSRGTPCPARCQPAASPSLSLAATATLVPHEDGANLGHYSPRHLCPRVDEVRPATNSCRLGRQPIAPQRYSHAAPTPCQPSLSCRPTLRHWLPIPSPAYIRPPLPSPYPLLPFPPLSSSPPSAKASEAQRPCFWPPKPPSPHRHPDEFRPKLRRVPRHPTPKPSPNLGFTHRSLATSFFPNSG